MHVSPCTSEGCEIRYLNLELNRDSVSGIDTPKKIFPAVDVPCIAEVEIRIQVFLDNQEPMLIGYRPPCVVYWVVNLLQAYP